MRIQLIEPYFAGSHRKWAEGFAAFSRHSVDILSLPGRYWKWRMHGGAVTLAGTWLERNLQPDLIFATDMLDLTTFLAITRAHTARIPAVVYFHENQLSYPWSPDDRDILYKRDRHYGFINYTTALAADGICFNSGYHRDSFFEELARLLKNFPDYHGLENIT
ncbi:MAG: tRNA-queuosine alpha-mannosyltransferase domain-containing protein, partial [Candidatus Aminicenantaceae bacterium]